MTNFVCILGWRFVGDFKRFLDTLSLFWRMRDRAGGGKSFCHFDVKKVQDWYDGPSPTNDNATKVRSVEDISPRKTFV